MEGFRRRHIMQYGHNRPFFSFNSTICGGVMGSGIGGIGAKQVRQLDDDLQFEIKLVIREENLSTAMPREHV